MTFPAKQLNNDATVVQKEDSGDIYHSGGGGKFGAASIFKPWTDYSADNSVVDDSGQFRHRNFDSAMQRFQKESDIKKLETFVDGLVDTGESFLNSAGAFASSAVPGILSSFTSPQTGVSAKPIVYSDWSPAAKLFGMDQDTAYSEHMVNTAHQREVADLKAAGLNPVLGISGSGSSAVSGNASVGSSSALKADNNMLLDVLGATAAVVTAVATKNPMYGYMVSNIFKAFD